MDLCVLLDPSSTPLPASELVTLIGNLLERGAFLSSCFGPLVGSISCRRRS
jgi:hypothetical protein